MSHYFSRDNDRLASAKREIRFVVGDREFRMMTDSGVFSKAGLDFGTRTMLENAAVDRGAAILDLGCGFGAVGVVLGVLFDARVTMTDINPRAVSLARENAAAAHLDAVVLEGDGCGHVPGFFDAVFANPPIRAGKAVVYRLFREAREKLKPDGRFVCVIRKDQGAASAVRELSTIYGSVETIARASGYHVLSCRI